MIPRNDEVTLELLRPRTILLFPPPPLEFPPLPEFPPPPELPQAASRTAAESEATEMVKN